MDLLNTSQNSSGSGRKSFFMRVGLAVGALLLVGVAVMALVLQTKAAPITNSTIPDSVAPQVASAKLIGPAAATQKLQLSLSLRSKNEAGLRDYATQVTQPQSKLYHQYITAPQFAQAFGANAATLSATERYLQSQGFHLDNTMSGGLLLNFTGTVAQAESAFHVHINNYTLGGQQFFANAENIQIPASLSGQLFNVAGLDTARQFHAGTITGKAPQPTATPKPSISVTCPTGPTVTATANTNLFTASGLRPAELRTAYNFPTYASSPGNNGWAAMIEFDGFQVYDLQQYEICAGINGTIQAATGTSPSASNPFIIVQNTATSFSSTPAAGANYGTPMAPGNAAAAVTGDLETLIGLAPYLQHISVIQNNPTPQGMLVALSVVANQDAAQTVGIPWGICEADVGFANASAEEYLFMQMALQGQSAFAATGNYGLYACYGDLNSGGNALRSYTFTAQDPASDPYVTAVGGTTLGTTGAAGAPGTGTVLGYGAEQPWNNYPSTGTNVPTVGQGFLGGAGGGGISLFWAAPLWQQSAKVSYNGTNPNGGAAASVGVLSAYVLNNANNPTAIGARVIPDVSAVADPVTTPVSIYCAVGATPCQTNATTFTTVGGTGIATAIWVAATSLAVQAANTPVPTTGIGTRLGIIAPSLYLTYQNDVTNGGAAATQVTLANGTAGSKFCDYAYVLNNALGAATAWGGAGGLKCQDAGTNKNYILNLPVPIGTALVGTTVNEVFPTLPAAPFQQAPATGIFALAKGFQANGGYLTGGNATVYTAGYTALTGLGSPNVGAITATYGANVQLATYLALQARVAIPRVYLVAQAQSTSTYWLGSYAFNPYVQNMPVFTQWYQLSSQQVFSGPPTIVDDGAFAGTGANAAQNLLIIGPSNGAANAYAVIDWNIASQTPTILPVSGISIPSSTAGNTSCSNVTAFTNATTVAVGTAFSMVGLYCLTPAGNVYVTNLNTFNGAAATGYTGARQAAWAATPVLSNVSSAPMVATDGAGNYELLVQTTGTGYNVVYTQVPILFTSTGATGAAATYGTMLTLPTTCNSTPSIAYVMQTAKYAVACIAKDTNAMWANTYDANVKGFNSFWTLLGQPSSSVTFLPGDAVAVDNITSDPGYGMVFYIAEGSDKGMYLSVVNTANSNFLFKSSMWQGVSLPGIFSSGAAAAFESN